MKSISTATIYKLCFSIIYACVVLPFTVNFFSLIAPPPAADSQLFNIIPLVSLHKIMLPMLLGILEFASVGLVCWIWLENGRYRKGFLVILYLACQILPVTSVYYDVRCRQYLKEHKDQEDVYNKSMDARKSNIEHINQNVNIENTRAFSEEERMLSQLQVMLNDNNKRLDLVHKKMDEYLGRKYTAKNEDVSVRLRGLEEEEKELKESNSKTESQIILLQNGIVENKKKSTQLTRSYSDSIRGKENDLQNFIQNKSGLVYASEQEYVAKTLLSTGSIFALLIAMIFPLTVVAVASIIANKAKTANTDSPSFDLSIYLRHAEELPQENQYNYARLLLPSIKSYFIAIKTSKTLANENVIMNLRNEETISLARTLGTYANQIKRSKMNEDAKNLLLEGINKTISKEIITEGDIAHVA